MPSERRRLLILLVLALGVTLQAQDWVYRQSANAALTFTQDSKVWMVIMPRRMDSGWNALQEAPKSIHFKAALPDDTDICIEPATGEKEVCMPFGELRKGFAQ